MSRSQRVNPRRIGPEVNPSWPDRGAGLRHLMMTPDETRSAATAAVCAKCGASIDSRESVWVVREKSTHMALCRACGWSYEPPREIYSLLCYPPGARWLWRSGSCDGCGRKVHILPRLRMTRMFCCGQCRSRFYRYGDDAISAARRKFVCEVCGSDFKPAKATARTCSDACRQRAYRARLIASRRQAGQDALAPSLRYR